MSTDSSADDLVFQALPLTGDAGDAFVGVAVLLQAMFLAEEPVAGLQERAFRLASRMVARARGGATTDAELRAAAIEATEEAARIGQEHGFEPSESLEEIPEELMRLAEELIREAALEEHTHDAYLALQGDTDIILLVVMPATPAAAHIWLLDSLYDRVEARIQDSPVQELERGASEWWFERWRPARPMEEEAFAASVREREWTLLERPALSTGSTFIEELIADEQAMAALPPRQRHMARQLVESVPGIWQVRERAGEDAVYLSAVDGSEHPVKEHGPAEDYGAGAVVIGRLIPFGDGTWLRSPGAAVKPYPQPDWTRALADAMKEAAALDLPPAIHLEAALTRVMTGDTVPRALPPARGASEARRILADVVPLFVEAGIAVPADPAALPPEVRTAAPAGPLLDYEVDEVVGDWLQALTQMSRKGTGGGKSRKKKR